MVRGVHNDGIGEENFNVVSILVEGWVSTSTGKIFSWG